MNIRNKNLFIILSLIALITACSDEPSIRSVTDDKVVIHAKPESFVQAYEVARKECLKSEKKAQYIAEENGDLKEVAFNCVSKEVVADAGAETQTEETTPMEPETVPETETTTQESPAQ